jgi:hypothetical protein
MLQRGIQCKHGVLSFAACSPKVAASLLTRWQPAAHTSSEALPHEFPALGQLCAAKQTNPPTCLCVQAIPKHPRLALAILLNRPACEDPPARAHTPDHRQAFLNPCLLWRCCWLPAHRYLPATAGQGKRPTPPAERHPAPGTAGRGSEAACIEGGRVVPVPHRACALQRMGQLGAHSTGIPLVAIQHRHCTT